MNPSPLHIDRTQWQWQAIGLLLLIGGLLSLTIGVLLSLAPDVPPEPPLAMLSVALLTLLGGGGLALGRHGTIIDRERQQVVRWWGLLRPMRRREFSLDQVDRVVIDLAANPRGRSRARYLRLSLQGAEAQIHLIETKSEPRIRDLADQVAAYLQLEVHDRTVFTELKRDAREPIVRKPPQEGQHAPPLSASSGVAPAIAPPANLSATIENTPQGVRITMPRQGFSPPLLMILAVSLIPISFFAFAPSVMASRSMRDADPDFQRMAATQHRVFSVCTMSISAFLALLLSFVAIKSARTQVRVDASPQEVAVQYGLVRTVFDAGQIVEIRAEGKGGNWTTPCYVLIRSRTRLARFGGGNLTRPEGDYLAQIVQAASDTPPHPPANGGA